MNAGAVNWTKNEKRATAKPECMKQVWTLEAGIFAVVRSSWVSVALRGLRAFSASLVVFCCCILWFCCISSHFLSAGWHSPTQGRPQAGLLEPVADRNVDLFLSLTLLCCTALQSTPILPSPSPLQRVGTSGSAVSFVDENQHSKAKSPLFLFP